MTSTRKVQVQGPQRIFAVALFSFGNAVQAVPQMPRLMCLMEAINNIISNKFTLTMSNFYKGGISVL